MVMSFCKRKGTNVLHFMQKKHEKVRTNAHNSMQKTHRVKFIISLLNILTNVHNY